MKELEKALASEVLDVLLERAHVVVAPARRDALQGDLEALIGLAVERLGPQLTRERRRARKRRVRSSPSSQSIRDTRRSEELVAELASQLTERLLESDHVDDVFAADSIIERDARRSLMFTLTRFARGELDVETSDDEHAVLVPLLELGYLVTEVVKRIELDMLRDALERAVATVKLPRGTGHLVNLNKKRVARFDLPGGAETGRLSLEEAITHELVELIEAELVELPSIEQVLELPHPTNHSSTRNNFDAAVERASVRTRDDYDCVAHALFVDDSTILATLTPLSEHSADHADAAFALFVQTLERELSVPTRASEFPDSGLRETGDSDQRDTPTSSRQERGEGKSAKAPPRSRPRGRHAPRAGASSTRQLRDTGTKRSKKRAK